MTLNIFSFEDDTYDQMALECARCVKRIKELIPLPSNNCDKEGNLDTRSYQGLLELRDRKKKILDDTTGTKAHPRRSALVSAMTGFGNCYEHACMSYTYLRANLPSNFNVGIFQAGNATDKSLKDHFFCMVSEASMSASHQQSQATDLLDTCPIMVVDPWLHGEPHPVFLRYYDGIANDPYEFKWNTRIRMKKGKSDQADFADLNKHSMSFAEPIAYVKLSTEPNERAVTAITSLPADHTGFLGLCDDLSPDFTLPSKKPMTRWHGGHNAEINTYLNDTLNEGCKGYGPDEVKYQFRKNEYRWEKQKLQGNKVVSDWKWLNKIYSGEDVAYTNGAHIFVGKYLFKQLTRSNAPRPEFQPPQFAMDNQNYNFETKLVNQGHGLEPFLNYAVGKPWEDEYAVLLYLAHHAKENIDNHCFF